MGGERNGMTHFLERQGPIFHSTHTQRCLGNRIELPGEYIDGRATQASGHLVWGGKAEKETGAPLFQRIRVNCIHFPGWIIDGMHVSQFLQNGGETFADKKVAVFRLAEAGRNSFFVDF